MWRAFTGGSCVMQSNSTIAGLRALLAEKFPAAPPRKSGDALPTGLADFDEKHGGLQRGVVTELHGSTGHGALFTAAMMEHAALAQHYLALVDAGRTFDPGSHAPHTLARLLWVQCTTAAHALKSADLLLRDGNLPLILLDLQSLPLRALGRIPANTWHRFQHVAAETTCAFVVLTPRPIVEAARTRIHAESRWNLGSLTRRRKELLGGFALQASARGALNEQRTA